MTPHSHDEPGPPRRSPGECLQPVLIRGRVDHIDGSTSGELHDSKGLKHRAEDEVRPVPIPPELVAILRWHIGEFGVAPDGRLFRQQNGNVVSSSTYTQVWQAARKLAFAPHQVASPLAGHPYDLRHTAVSLWLNSGVPAPTVAPRAGNSVDVLLRVYANCIDGDDDIANGRISHALNCDYV